MSDTVKKKKIINKNVKGNTKKMNDSVKRIFFQTYRICYNNDRSKGKKELKGSVDKKGNGKQETQGSSKKEMHSSTSTFCSSNKSTAIDNEKKKKSEQEKSPLDFKKYYERIKKWNEKRTGGLSTEKKTFRNFTLCGNKVEKKKLLNIDEKEQPKDDNRQLSSCENKNEEQKKNITKETKQVEDNEKCLNDIDVVENDKQGQKEMKKRKRKTNEKEETEKEEEKEKKKKKINGDIYSTEDMKCFQKNNQSVIPKIKSFQTSKSSNLLNKKNTKQIVDGYETHSQHSEIREQVAGEKTNCNGKKSYETVLNDIGKDLYSNKTFRHSNDHLDIPNYLPNPSNNILASNQTQINYLVDMHNLPSNKPSKVNSSSTLSPQEYTKMKEYELEEIKTFSNKHDELPIQKSKTHQLHKVIRENSLNDVVNAVQNVTKIKNTKNVISSIPHTCLKGNTKSMKVQTDKSQSLKKKENLKKNPENVFNKKNCAVHFDNVSDVTPPNDDSAYSWGDEHESYKTNLYQETAKRRQLQQAALMDNNSVEGLDTQTNNIQSFLLSCTPHASSSEKKERGQSCYTSENSKEDNRNSNLYIPSENETNVKETDNEKIVHSFQYSETSEEKRSILDYTDKKYTDVDEKYIYDNEINDKHGSMQNTIMEKRDEQQIFPPPKKIINMDATTSSLEDIYNIAEGLEINTHKKLIEIPPKKMKNNFDIMLCLFVKNEQREQFFPCLLLDEELTEQSYFFKTNVKSIFDHYKEIKIEKLKQKNHFISINDFHKIKPNKLVLQILTSTVHTKYIKHLDYLYNKQKDQNDWDSKYDMVKEIKEIRKRLKEKETATVGNGKRRNHTYEKFRGDYETKIELIEKPLWNNKKDLEEMIKKQQNYNPFTIFGTSINEVNLEEIFTLDVYNNYVTDEDRYKNKILYELYVSDHIKNLYKRIEPSEWEIVINTLQKSWAYFINLECNMSLDPLLLEEILWYIDVNNMYKDQSKKMFIYEPCFCPTPDPAKPNNLNDLKNFAISMETKYITNSSQSSIRDDCMSYEIDEDNIELENEKDKYKEAQTQKKKQEREREKEKEREAQKGIGKEKKKENENENEMEDKKRMEWDMEDEHWEVVASHKEIPNDQSFITYSDSTKWRNKNRITTKQLVCKIPRPSGNICYYSDYFKNQIVEHIKNLKKMKNENNDEVLNDNSNTSDQESDTDPSKNINDGDIINSEKEKKKKNEPCIISFSKSSPHVAEDVFLKNKNTKEWTSQRVFDNFFFNYYLNNFHRCNCECKYKCQCNSMI